MRKQYQGYIVTFLGLAMVLAGVFGASFVFARGNNTGTTSQVNISGSGKTAHSTMESMHVVDMQTVPAETAGSPGHLPIKSLPVPASNPTVYAKLKAEAAHNKNAPRALPVQANPKAISTDTPGATKHFQGMADSTSICAPFGCQPPDQALAASTKWVLQGVNSSFAVYSPGGALQTGWPKNSRTFFGIPNPGTCAPNGAFTSDPRAFYDPNDGRFWVAMLEVEGAAGINNCPFATRYWIAVSRISDPRGLWNIYAFDMSLGTTNIADYTMFGFDQQAMYISANMFNQAATVYEYSEIFAGSKSTMESGGAVTLYGFTSLSVTANRTVLVDTVQPVEAQAHSYGGPSGGLFVNAFNGGEFGQFNGDPFGDNCITTNCHGLALWTLTNPGTSSTGLTFAFVDTNAYVLPPSADEPGCPGCVDSLDTRISGTPVYHNGLLSFALETGIYNGSQVVPGILWGQVSPQLLDDGTLNGATLFQQGYWNYGGDAADSFGTLMPDADGDLFMVFEFMSSSTNPEVAYTARRVAYLPGTFHDGGFILKAGAAPTNNFRWGDFEATSYDGPSSDNVWFSGEYSAANGDWSTFIGRDKFCIGCN